MVLAVVKPSFLPASCWSELVINGGGVVLFFVDFLTEVTLKVSLSKAASTASASALVKSSVFLPPLP